MSRLAVLMLSLFLALPVMAERKQTFGDLDVHYSAFNSSFLQPQIAETYGLVRSKERGVLAVSIVKEGKGQQANVDGTVKDLLGKTTDLGFRQVTEGDAVYYLAQYAINGQETLVFTLNVRINGETHSFSFNQDVHPDQ